MCVTICWNPSPLCMIKQRRLVGGVIFERVPSQAGNRQPASFGEQWCRVSTVKNSVKKILQHLPDGKSLGFATHLTGANVDYASRIAVDAIRRDSCSIIAIVAKQVEKIIPKSRDPHFGVQDVRNGSRLRSLGISGKSNYLNFGYWAELEFRWLVAC